MDKKDQELNSSGRGRSSEVPAEVRRWNWAAFLIAPIWAIAAGVYWVAVAAVAIGVAQIVLGDLGAYATVPLVIVGLAFATYLGFNGNKLAWCATRWDSPTHLLAVQAKLTRWVVIIVAAVVALQLLIALLAYA